MLDTSTAGTAVASKALILGATKNIDTLLFDIASPAAGGVTQALATAMTADTNFVTGADDTAAVVLPTAVAGRRVWIKNTVANKVLPVFPATDAQINALGANNAITLPAGCLCLFLAKTSTLWYALQLMPDGLTADAAELNLLDGSTAGQAVASKALALGTTKNVDTLLFDIAAPAAAGANQGNATAMTADTNAVTGADGTVGVKLPVAVAGRRILVKNVVANQILKVYPNTDAAIDALGANNAISLPAGCLALFIATSATQWYALSVPYGITATAAEINTLAGVTAGAVTASKAMVAGATKNIDTLLFDVATPAAAGADQAGATDLTADTNLVTGADDAVGVELPVAVAGRRIIVKNTVANKILKVYPAGAAAINALGASTAISLPAGCLAVFVAESATQWWTTAIPDGITATAAELNYLDGPTPAAATPSKAAVLGASQNLDVLGLPVGGLKIGAAGAEVAVTSSAAELNILTGVTATATEINTAADADSLAADGLLRMGIARFTFDPSGVAGSRTVDAHGTGVTLPINAVTIGGFVEVNTVFHSEGADAGTIAIHVEGADDIIAATAVSGAPYSSIGLKAIVPKSNTPESTGIKCTAAREITCTVAGQALTAGKLTGFLHYVVSAVSA
jgi:hypothetical protein